MKTINKTLAFLFAASTFTACTNQSVEPMHPATQATSTVSQPDTMGRISLNEDGTPTKYLHGKAMISDNINSTTLYPETTVEPTPHTAPVINPDQKPRLGVMPVEQSNDLQ